MLPLVRYLYKQVYVEELEVCHWKPQWYTIVIFPHSTHCTNLDSSIESIHLLLF